ncbi:MAG: SH3 domain-containing protein [Nitrospirae bacterium]|nr:SH3 domain-containing protein [Nitrospirota bacterium]
MNRIIRLLIAILMLTALTSSVHAGAETAAAEAFKTAAAYYVEGKYDAAIKEYYKLIQEGYEGGSLYYNIGNCFLKKNNIGYALLYYEKAMRLIPADDDLKANYEYAQSLIKNRQTSEARPWLNRQLDKIYNPLTIVALTILLAFLYVLIFAILTAGVFIEKIKNKFSTSIISAAAVLFLISSYELYERVNTGHSIVLTEKAEARYEPFEKATVFFTVFAGMKVEVIDTEDKWYKIKRPDGKAGWVPKQDIGLI